MTCAFASPPGTLAVVGPGDNLAAPVDVITANGVKEVTMNMGIKRWLVAAGVAAAAAGWLAVATAPGAAGASRPQHTARLVSHSASAPHRQIGTAELTYFKVVLTVTRGTGQPPTATVTAAGYERSGAGWKLIAVQRIGQPGQWFWHAVQTCSLDITQSNGVSPVQALDSAKVSLLATPALGCTQPFSVRWNP
jgi:hypothetical protein